MIPSHDGTVVGDIIVDGTIVGISPHGDIIHDGTVVW